jgi:hypothetical protein
MLPGTYIGYMSAITKTEAKTDEAYFRAIFGILQ